MSHQLNYSDQASQVGFTMLEMLISMFVLSVGVLGVAALQLTTLENLQISHQNGIAAMLADDISERMLANAEEAASGSYIHSEAVNNPPDCEADDCTKGELANFDVAEWQNNLAELLPSSAGSVERVGSTNDFLVTVFWDDDLSGSTDLTCPPQDEGDLDCYQARVGLWW